MGRYATIRNTTPVTNIVNSLEGMKEMNEISRALSKVVFESRWGRNIVKFTQERLGKQTRTFTGEFRYYLWEFKDYTLWVANGKGFSVEVLPTLTYDEALAAYREAFLSLDSRLTPGKLL